MAEPIVTRLPDTKRAVENKYGQNPQLVDPTSPISRALVALDVKRSQKGQNPISVRQHQLALQAIQTRQSPIPEPDRGIFSDFVNDVKTLTASIPRLPMALFQEAKALPTLPAELSKAMETPGGPLKQLSAISQAPGVRLLPGAFVAQNIETPGELANHPLFTLLDVLPAGRLPAAKAAKAKLIEQVAPKLAPITDPIAFSLKTSKPGMAMQEAWGKTARDVSQLKSQADETIKKQLYGEKPIDDPLANFARRANNVAKNHPEISESRRVELTRLMQEDADSIRSLAPNEQSFINEVRDVTDQLGDFAAQEGLLSKIDGEFYSTPDAKRILSTRRKATIASEFNAARTSITTPAPDVDSLLTSMRNVLRREDIKPGAKLKLIEGYAHGVETLGIDGKQLLDAVKANRRKYSAEGISSAIDEFIPTPITAITIDDVVTRLTPIARTDPLAARILDHVKSNRWKEARSLAKRVSRRTKFPIPDIESIIDRASRGVQRERYLKSTANFSDKVVSKLETKAAKTLQQTVPARFQPRLSKELQRRLTVKLSDNPKFEEILPYLRERNYGWLTKEGLLDEVEFSKVVKEVESGWQELKSSGYDPVFVHRLSEGKLGSLQYPKVLEHVPTPSSTRKRIMDITPSLDDVSIALPHQALEFLSKRGSEEFISTIIDRWGKSRQTVLDMYIPAARQLAKTPDDVLRQAESLMNKEWVQYDPSSIINWQSARISAYKTNQVMMPRTVSNTIQRMHTPPGGRLTSIMDPIMNVFRTSILPLSVRWHVYNLLGGGIVLTGQTGPDVWRYLGDARKMVKAGEMPEQLPHGFGMVPRDFREYTKSASLSRRLEATFKYQGGATLRKLFDQARPARDAFGKVVEKSYDFNGFVDDTYRTMAYLYGRDKALTKGLSKKAAEAAGEELTRKTLQNWDRMTPIERSIMRYVFPFYGWMQHIIRYSLKYPVDHPFRTAVMGSFSRNELDDMGTGLPERFLNTFFLGDMDKDGNTTGLNIAGMNPFRDVANYFTLSGFLGQTNPIITSIMQSIGIDPMSGAPELFPTLRYDPDAGRLTVQSQNPITNFIQATVPQTRILAGMFDSSSEFQALLRTNPEAAKRLLVSQAGLPILFREVNIPQEVTKNIIAREEDQSMVLNEALKSGDWSEAERYPQLQPLLSRIKELQSSGALESYQPQSQGQVNIGVAQEALKDALLPG